MHSKWIVALSLLCFVVSIRSEDIYFDGSGEEDNTAMTFPTDDEDIEEASGYPPEEKERSDETRESPTPTAFVNVPSSTHEDSVRYEEDAERITNVYSQSSTENHTSVPPLSKVLIPDSNPDASGHPVLKDLLLSSTSNPQIQTEAAVNIDVLEKSTSSLLTSQRISLFATQISFSEKDVTTDLGDGDIGFDDGEVDEQPIDVKEEPEVMPGIENRIKLMKEKENTEEVKAVEAVEDDFEVDDELDKSEVSSFAGSTHFIAAVVVGGCIGLLFAVAVIMLLVYRMRKKDEGSYALEYGDGKKAQGNYEYTKGVDSKEYYA